jgi:phospholipid transport system substrate-binding protein
MKRRPIAIFRRSVLTLVGVMAVATALCARPAAARAANPEVAVTFVTELTTEAINILRQAEANDIEEQKDMFRDILHQGFDFNAIGRLILGRHWRTASKEQRADYLRLFPEYVLRTYSSMLGGYTDERFEIGRAKPVGKADMMVDSRIVGLEGPPVVVNWRVRVINEQYKVIDVSVEGVSMILTKRSEFSSVIKNKGFDGLLNALQPPT